MKRTTKPRRAGKPDSITERERRFVEHYMGDAAGNATQAARLAGYSKKTARKQGSRLLTKGHIRAAIDARAHADPRIATREDLQRFWSAMYRNPAVEDRDRLRASELLGKSQAVFIDRHQLEAGASLETLLADIATRGTERGSR